MRILMMSKAFKEFDLRGLIELGQWLGIEGWDLAVREGYAVSPENVATALPAAARQMAAEGLPLVMITGALDLLLPDGPGVQPLLRAMGQADVRMLKLGFFRTDPRRQDYWREVERVRRAMAGWEALGRQFGVKIVYQTHSGAGYMGLNCAALMHLIKDLDPQHIGAYLDPGHLLINGEPFELAAAMAQPYLALIGLKDCRPQRLSAGEEGDVQWDWVLAGRGAVRWSHVFEVLAGRGYAGDGSVHAEFAVPPHAPGLLREMARADVTYFKARRDAAFGLG